MHPVSSVAGALSLLPPRSLSPSVSNVSPADAANMQVCKGISAYLFQSLLAIKSSDGHKGPVCSPMPQRSPDGLLYELAISGVIPGPGPVLFSPCPLPDTPCHIWKRMKRQVACRRQFVTVCRHSRTKKKGGCKLSVPRKLEGFCDLWLLITKSDSMFGEVMAAVILGITSTACQNLRHFSRICHFLQAYKHQSELLALVTCFPMLLVVAKFCRLSPRPKKK